MTRSKIVVLAFLYHDQSTLAKFGEMVAGSETLKDRISLIRPISEEKTLEALPEAEVFLCYSFPPEWLSNAKNLRWIHVAAAGVDHVLTPELVHSSIRVTNARGIQAEVQSDFIIGTMVMWSRKLLWAEQLRRDHQWEDWSFAMTRHGFELKGKILLIIGLGAIGKVLAKKATAMGLEVHAIKRSMPDKADLLYVDRSWQSQDLLEALKQADFVALLLPLTGETNEYLGPEAFQNMKPTAFLVNTSRGRVVDEKAMILALKEKQIAGAALDVFQNEPLEEDSPLWELDNVILTPHIAGIYAEILSDMYKQFVTILEQYVRGEPLDNEVNKELGY